MVCACVLFSEFSFKFPPFSPRAVFIVEPVQFAYYIIVGARTKRNLFCTVLHTVCDNVENLMTINCNAIFLWWKFDNNKFCVHLLMVAL
jgi:hypothetical protein